ncbi:hypothetical protein BGY98DRAFT_881633, partial [Russula aff. rugulosa BPL654]
RLSKDWVAPIYAFFRPDPLIVHVDGRRCHAFECIAKSCKHKTRVVWRYLDKGDAKSTGNLRKHTKRCWGNEVVAAADKAKTARDVCDATAKGFLDPQLITSAFKRSGKGKVSYSYRQFTKTESKAEIVRWVSESMRPFFSRDIKQVFVNARKRIATILKGQEGTLSFATDAWTSPNHKAFVAVTVHFEKKGVPICMLLDIVEVAK